MYIYAPVRYASACYVLHEQIKRRIFLRKIKRGIISLIIPLYYI